MHLANNNFLRWDRHDQELVATFLNNHKQVCFKCENVGHFSTTLSTCINMLHHIRHPVALSTATTSISSAYSKIHAALTPIPVQSAPTLTPKHTAYTGHVDNFRPLPTAINSPVNIEFIATLLLNYPKRNRANYFIKWFLVWIRYWL